MALYTTHGIRLRSFPKRAERSLLFSRRTYFLALICFTVIHCLQIHTFAQQTNTIRTEEELITTLMKADGDRQTSLQNLLQDYSSLVTPRLWKKLIAKATSAY